VKMDHTIAAVAGTYVNFCLIDKHGLTRLTNLTGLAVGKQKRIGIIPQYLIVPSCTADLSNSCA